MRPIFMPPADEVTALSQNTIPDFLDLAGLQTQQDIAASLDLKIFEHQKLMNYAIDNHKRVVGVSSRRSGKTYFFTHKITDRGMAFDIKDYPGRPDSANGRFMFIAPSLKQAMEIAWPTLETIGKKVGAKVKKSENRIVLENGAEVILAGARNHDSLRGTYLDGVLFDEYAFMDPEVWSKIIAPQMIDYDGWACFFSTPQGRNHFFDLFTTGMEKPEWAAFRFPASRINHFKPGVLENYRLETGEYAYRQEMECDFDAPVRGAYWGEQIYEIKGRGQVGSYPFDPDQSVFASIDLGVNDEMVIWWGQVINKRPRWLGCRGESGKSLEWVAQELQAFQTKHECSYSLIALPHDIKNREMGSDDGDGHALPREVILRKSLKAKGVCKPSAIRLVPKHPIPDRIQAARSMIRLSDFHAVDAGVTKGLNALSLYQREWDGDTNSYGNKPKHDWTSHYADSFAYMCYMLSGSMAKAAEKASKEGEAKKVLTKNPIDDIMDTIIKVTPEGEPVEKAKSGPNILMK